MSQVNFPRFFVSLCIFVFASSSLMANRELADQNNVIYGKDNRSENSDYRNSSISQMAKSVAVQISNQLLSLNPHDSNLIDFLKITLRKSIPNLCPTERFLDQYAIGDCTGFLISSNRLLTAGHCVYSDYDCENKSWVFDYTQDKQTFKARDVYQCKSIIANQMIYEKNKILDYAIIELDRPTDRGPLPRRKFGRPIITTPLVVIGYPRGLPQKIADGARVMPFNADEWQNPIESLHLRKYYFISNLDTYGGNSGSPVINRLTGKVEGILIQGADDFIYDEKNNCMKSNILKNSFKSASEKVLRINEIPELKN